MTIEMIFCPGNTCQAQLPLIDRLLREIPPIPKLPLTSATKRGEFAAYLVLDTILAGFAVGRYSTSPFESVSRHNLPRDSDLTWIQIFNRGRGHCRDFMIFILKNLQSLGIDFVEIDNVGGIAGCRCYLNAVQALGGRGGHLDVYRNFAWFHPNKCESQADEVNLLILPSARLTFPQFFM
jgi:hypothetical protein